METSTIQEITLIAANTGYLVIIGIILAAISILDFLRRLILPGKN